MCRYCAIFLVLSLIFGISTHLFAQQPPIALPMGIHYASSDYEAGMQNWGIAQDSRGLMYVANNFGMLEYDGSQWRLMPVQSSAKVRAVAIGDRGAIYVGGQRCMGYFLPDSVGQWAYHSLLELLPKGVHNFEEIWRIYCTPEGVFFCSFKQIMLYRNQKIELIYEGNSLGFSHVVDRKLIIFDFDKGLLEWQGGNFRTLPGVDLLRENQSNIAAILPFSKSAWAIFSVSGDIFLYEGSTLSKVGASPHVNLSKAIVNCAIRMDNGDFAVGTQNQGVVLFDAEWRVKTWLSESRGLYDRTVYFLYQDHAGNLWAAMNHGISCLEVRSPFALISEQLGVPGTGYAALIANDCIYLGTTNGLFVAKKGELSYQMVEGSEGQVYHLSNIDGQVLMGHHKGAFVVEGNKAKVLFKKEGAWKFMKPMQRADRMLQGCYSGMQLYEKKGNQWVEMPNMAKFSESSRVIEEDADGSFWMTHGYKGVFKWQIDWEKGNVAATFYNSKNGFPSDILINVFKIGGKLLFPAERDIYKYNQAADKFEKDEDWSARFGSGAHVTEMEQDLKGNIYYLSDRGMGLIKRNGDSYENELNIFGSIEEMVSDDLENITAIDHQNVLIGAKEGFIYYDPSWRVQNADSLTVIIRKVVCRMVGRDSLIFGGSFTENGYISNEQPASHFPVLSYEENNLSFQFAAPFYGKNPNLRFKYRLEGFEKDWSAWAAKPDREYTNLPEGKYTLAVVAKNAYNQESAIVHYRFRILPPWYRTTVAYTIYTISALLIIGVVLLAIDKRYAAQQRMLRVKQERVLHAKQLEIEDVSRKSEVEINRLQTEKLEAEIAHKNKELATSAMNLLNKSEFLAHLKANLQALLKNSEKDGNSLPKEIKRLVNEIDSNMEDDDIWAPFQFHFDQVHGDFSERINHAYPDLSPQERKLCACLRMNMSTKEIAQLLNISARGVEIARYRLRKRLDLPSKANLAQFILGF